MTLYLADDVTGAGALAGLLRARGPSSLVNWAGFNSVKGLVPPFGSLVVSLDTRDQSEPVIRDRLVQAFAVAREIGRPVRGLRVDSLLRGSVTAHLEALLATGVARKILVVPHHPVIRREARWGVIWEAGEPIGEGPRSLTSREDVQVVDVSLPGSIDRLQDALTRDDVAPIVLAESTSMTSIVEIAGMIRSFTDDVVVVDPGLLMSMLAGAGNSGALIVMGTNSAQTMRQLERLQATSSVSLIDVSARSNEAADTAGEIREQEKLLRSGRSIALTCVRDRARARGIEASIEALALWASRITRGPTDGVVVSGGSTASALLSAVDASSVEMARLLSPLVSLGTIRGGAWDGAAICLKGGDAGSPDELVWAVANLMCPKE